MGSKKKSISGRKNKSDSIPPLPLSVDVTSSTSDTDKTYAYKRENLGLNINLIAVGTSPRGVQAMTWAFHKTNDFDFNQDEFRVFWHWLMNEIYISQKRKKSLKEEKEKVDV